MTVAARYRRQSEVAAARRELKRRRLQRGDGPDCRCDICEIRRGHERDMLRLAAAGHRAQVAVWCENVRLTVPHYPARKEVAQ